MYFENKDTAMYIIREKIKANNIVCLKENNKILGIALSEEGLRGIANKSGRYLYTGATNLKDAYKKPKLRWLKVEKFVPNEFPTKNESLHADHAYRLVNIQ